MTNRKWTLFVGCLLAAMGVGAQEQIESPLISEHDSAYYAEQTKAWQQQVDKHPEDAAAWRNLYQAANYMRWFAPHDTTAIQVVRQMGEAVPDSYEYHYCQYKELMGSDEAFLYAEGALQRLPQEMSFHDYDMWTAYLAMAGDERRLAKLCVKYYESGLYSPAVLQYNYNELQGMEEGAVCFANGDAMLIPKWLLQHAKGMHRDKLVVAMSFLSIPTYRNHILSCLGIDSTLYQYEQPHTQEEYDRQERELIDLIIAHSHRPIYFSTTVGSEHLKAWEHQLYNEGLTLHYSATRYDNMAVKRRNVEERYLLEYLLEQFTPDHWATASNLSGNYAVLFKDLLAWYKKNDVKRYKWLMRILVSAVDGTHLSQERKNHFLSLLK